MPQTIHVAILDDHLPTVDGYLFRLSKIPDIEVVAARNYGDDLEPMLALEPVDVLLLDVQVPINPENSNPFPIMHWIPRILEAYPDLSILIISMHAQRSLIKAVMKAGVSGYMLKDDHEAYSDLESIIRQIAAGGMYMSEQARQQLGKLPQGDLNRPLSPRQLEALSLCAAYPNDSLATLGQKMNVANATIRNLLSSAYLKMGVNTRHAAVAKAQHLGLLIPAALDPDEKIGGGGY
jgi:DNA-binding NarL/FixJ family response regulator